MFQVNFGDIAITSDSLATPFGIAVALFGLTLFAGRVAHPSVRAGIGRWLSATHTDWGWSRSFTALFDAVFGDKHLSPKCIARSAIASLAAVALIYWLMDTGTVTQRFGRELTWRDTLLIALAINLVADYLSLLETRWLLGQIHNRQWHHWSIQALILLADLALSAAIIGVAITLYTGSPLHQGDKAEWSEIAGALSIYAVFFYSTFLTSVWTWAYILSSWAMRLIRWVRLGSWLDVENNPVTILALLIALSTGAGGLALSPLFQKDATGLTPIDHALCQLDPGKVCLRIAELTDEEQIKLDFLMRACAGGVTAECMSRGMDAWEVEPEEAAKLLTSACAGGNARGCSNLGYLYEKGLGVAQDPVRAAELYGQGCDGGNAIGCSNLGYLYEKGLGVAQDPVRAAELYGQACDGGNAGGCSNLGYLYEKGLGVAQDPVRAAELYGQGCDGGNARGCSNLGILYEDGLGVTQDPVRAAELYGQACDGGNAGGCTGLGYLYREGLGVPQDPVRAAELYGQGCDGGNARGCTSLGYLYEKGLGVPQDPVRAAELYGQGCDGGNAIGCSNLGIMHEYGRGVDLDLSRARDLYQRACDMGREAACGWAAELAED